MDCRLLYVEGQTLRIVGKLVLDSMEAVRFYCEKRGIGNVILNVVVGLRGKWQ